MEGAFRSDDGGASWNYIGRHLSHSNVLTIAVEPGNSNRLYAGNAGGIDISDDGGHQLGQIIKGRKQAPRGASLPIA